MAALGQTGPPGLRAVLTNLGQRKTQTPSEAKSVVTTAAADWSSVLPPERPVDRLNAVQLLSSGPRLLLRERDRPVPPDRPVQPCWRPVPPDRPGIAAILWKEEKLRL